MGDIRKCLGIQMEATFGHLKPVKRIDDLLIDKNMDAERLGVQMEATFGHLKPVKRVDDLLIGKNMDAELAKAPKEHIC